MGYEQHFKVLETILNRIFGGPTTALMVTDTYQFDDYSKYVATAFDIEEKTRRRDEVFPQDCRKAFELGVTFAR